MKSNIHRLSRINFGKDTRPKTKDLSKKQITFTKIFLITGLIFTTLLAVANNTPFATAVSSTTEKTIRDYFKFPQILLPRYEANATHVNKVEVLFTTDKSGKVNFVMAKTLNNELKLEIEKQFSHLQLPKVKQNVVHSVMLNFRTL